MATPQHTSYGMRGGGTKRFSTFMLELQAFAAPAPEPQSGTFLAALLLRRSIIYYVFPHLDWDFVSVDDFRWILRASNEQWLTPAVLAVLLVLGIPLSWGKTVLSEINKRLVLVISSRSPFVQMARVKHVIVLALLQDLAEAKVFTSKAIEEALGRIQWPLPLSHWRNLCIPLWTLFLALFLREEQPSAS